TQRQFLRVPVVRIGLGVAPLAFCLAAGDAFVTGASAPRNAQPEAREASFYALYAAAVTSALFFFWRQKKNLSHVDAFNLSVSAMPVALFVSIFLFSLIPFPDLR